MNFMLIIAASFFASIASTAEAQSRAPTYKCETAGKVTYSDNPCVGAKLVDTSPTQGLSKLSGQTRKGADVQRVENNAAMAEALKPVFNESASERAKRHARAKMTTAEKLDCDKLDGLIKGGNGSDDVKLYQDRKRFKDLKC